MTRLIQFLFKNLINIGSSILKEASHKRSYLWYIPHTIISLIRESWTLSNSHLQLNFLNSVTVLALLLPVCEKPVPKNGYLFPRVTAFLFLFEQCMWEKWKSLFYHPWYLFLLQPNKNQSAWAKVSSYEIHCCQMRKLEEVLAYPRLTEI